jgi:hypothetical protein
MHRLTLTKSLAILSLIPTLSVFAACEQDPSACDTLGATRCLADGTATERCRSDGRWSVVQTCDPSQVCVTDIDGVSACMNEADIPSCSPPGAMMCAADFLSTLTCRADGTWEVAEECANPEVCKTGTDGVSSCQAAPDTAPCSPLGATMCSADGLATLRCRSDGEWGVVQGCTETQSCVTNDGVSTCEEDPEKQPSPIPTITDATSPWYDRGCPLDQHREMMSDLVADCRCFSNQTPVSGIDVCKRPRNVSEAGVSVGEGPSYASLFNIEFLGGFLEESEGAEGTLYVAVGFGASTERMGAVFAVDVATGNRRVVSGLTPEGQTVGSGPAFATVNDVRRGPDGKLYAWVRTPLPGEQEIVRIDPTTGNRTRVWKAGSAESPQCRESDGPDALVLQVADSGFAVGPDGAFYVPFRNPTQGVGILRLPSDLSRCEVFIASGGSGPAIGGFIQGFTIRGSKLYAFTTLPKQFLEVSLTSGDRRLVHTPSGVTPPERWAAFDETRGVWWLAGFQNAVSIEAFDPDSGLAASIFNGGIFPWMPLGAAGPIQINALNYAPIWARSNGNLLVAQDGMSIVEYEPSTGNSVILSL